MREDKYRSRWPYRVIWPRTLSWQGTAHNFLYPCVNKSMPCSVSLVTIAKCASFFAVKAYNMPSVKVAGKSLTVGAFWCNSSCWIANWFCQSISKGDKIVVPILLRLFDIDPIIMRVRIDLLIWKSGQRRSLLTKSLS